MTLLLLVLSIALAGPPRSIEGGDGGVYAVELATRTGLFVGIAPTWNPHHFGGAAVGEGAVILNRRYELGMRLDGYGVLGIDFQRGDLTDFHLLTGILPKFAVRHGDKVIQSILAISAGGYLVNSAVTDDTGVGALAPNGFAVGVIPEAGVDFGFLRISLVSRIALGPAGIPPVFGLEFTGVPWRLDLESTLPRQIP